MKKKRVTKEDLEKLGVETVAEMILSELEKAEEEDFYIEDAEEILDQLGELLEALEDNDE